MITGDDIVAAEAACRNFLAPHVGADWSGPVPGLDFTVASVVAHAASGPLRYALDLWADPGDDHVIMIGVTGIDRHEVDGVTLAVRSWPCREAAWPPVVLLPGTGSTAGDWDVIAARLCADRAVFAVDLRGHGGSSWPGTYAISLMAGDVTALLPLLSGAQVDLVGHSLGGLVACQVAVSEQARVRRLVLEDTGMPHPRPPQAPARPAGPLSFDWAVVEQIRPEIDEPDSRWPQVMAAIGVPTLVIGGGTSSFLPQEHVQELVQTVAHGTRVTIDAGHLVHATKPDAFLAELTAFLNS